MWQFSTLCLCLGLYWAHAIPREVLYPFGADFGDQRLEVGDDTSSNEIQLEVPIAFYDDVFRSVYVNLNGHLSFETDLPLYRSDLVIPFGYKLIAPFWADIDIQLSGNVYFRETRDPSLLEMAARELHPNFPKYRNFRPRALFIATWDNVGYFEKKYDPLNTFQVVVASDGVDSFVMFLYPEIGWIKSDGKGGPTRPDIPAQAGFDAGDRRRSLVLRGSGSEQVRQLADDSNAGAPGVWMFKIGNLYGGDIETSESDGPSGPQELPTSCAAGGDRECSANGQCQDYSGGFCCECQSPYVGNGINCVQPDIQMRVNGKVSGTVNGLSLGDSDLHAFLMFKDGRAYIAISGVAPQLGYSLQGLYAFAGGLGWLLALPNKEGERNGYIISGGDFNRTATVTFPDLGQSVTIRQTFKGLNADGHMEMTSVVNGNIPNIPEGAGLEIPDYTDVYQRLQPGVMRSQSSQTFLLDGSPVHFTVDQTLAYQECAYRANDRDDATVSVDVTRSFIHYEDENQQIVRYAQSNRISKGEVDDRDPCTIAGFPCDDNAACVPYGGSHQCQCNGGYRLDRTQRCVDVDECAENQHTCDQNADCYNGAGSYQCRCRQGYAGDGFSCERDLSCGDLVCDVNAGCYYDADLQQPVCQCNRGYQGDGTRCTPKTFDCSEVNNCDENAECRFDDVSRRWECVCEDGFSGDGLACTDTGEEEIGCFNCHAKAECVYDVYRLTFVCQCYAGYSGTGQDCTPIGGEQSEDCGHLNCDINAGCVYDDYSARYVCQCQAGYEGDGYVCRRVRDCSVYNYCDRNARCTPDQSGRYQCVCDEGYSGDGATCTEASCNVINNCDINAECLLDPHSSTYECRCRHGYQGDGFNCRLTADCRRDPGICDGNARCENRGYDYVCVCNPGYRGDGYRCAPLGAKESYLMIAQGMSILQMPFSPTDADPGRTVLSIPGQTAIGIDVDCYARYFYWSDIAGRAISKAQLDGTDSQVLVSGLGSPEGIAIDWITGNMYWTDSLYDRIDAAKTDGTSRKTIVSGEIYDPRGIVVDPISGTMFWTDWHRRQARIETASLDGSNRRVLVDTDVGLPNGLTLDFDTHHICWVDAESKRIECVNYEGAGRRVIYTHADYPFDITYTHNVFYWTDWHKDNLQSINKFASEANAGLSVPVGGHGRMYGLAVVKSQCPTGSNACALNNGGCRFICFPTPNGGRTCACPDDINQDECNRLGVYL